MFVGTGPRRALANVCDTGLQNNSPNAIRNYAELRTFLDDVYLCRIAKDGLEDGAGLKAIRQARNAVRKKILSICFAYVARCCLVITNSPFVEFRFWRKRNGPNDTERQGSGRSRCGGAVGGIRWWSTREGWEEMRWRRRSTF